MKRLTRENVQVRNNVITSINISQDMAKRLKMEQRRVGAKNRSELIRMILENYFELEIEETGAL